MSNPTHFHFLVNKKNITEHTSKEELRPEVSEGEALLKINKYAFTSNNITYAVVGDQMKYWNFFPAEEPYGIVPVWGYAEVTESKNEAIKEGLSLIHI